VGVTFGAGHYALMWDFDVDLWSISSDNQAPLGCCRIKGFVGSLCSRTPFC